MFKLSNLGNWKRFRSSVLVVGSDTRRTSWPRSGNVTNRTSLLSTPVVDHVLRCRRSSRAIGLSSWSRSSQRKRVGVIGIVTNEPKGIVWDAVHGSRDEVTNARGGLDSIRREWNANTQASVLHAIELLIGESKWSLSPSPLRDRLVPAAFEARLSRLPNEACKSMDWDDPRNVPWLVNDRSFVPPPRYSHMAMRVMTDPSKLSGEDI